MERGFWQNLKKPIIGLAPMDGVTDAAFRFVTGKYGKPDLTITEFTSVEGISAGATKTLKAFIYDESERPICAQIFGHTPDAFYKAAFIIAELGFDGIDINMGCPAKNVATRGSGAGLILTPDLAKKIVISTKKAAKDFSNGKRINEIGLPENIVNEIKRMQEPSSSKTERKILPVSIKTRIGYDKIAIEEWTKHLLEVEPANISIHGRTLKQMYGGNANWEAIAAAADLAHKTNTTILGNGDIKNLEDAHNKIKQYNVDGVLIGRCSFGNPWIFKNKEPTLEEKFKTACEHAKIFQKIFGENLFVNMRKHLSWYCRGFSNASEIRQKLMTTNNFEEVEKILGNLTSL